MTEFSKDSRIQLRHSVGTNPIMQERWEALIKMELQQLKEFSAEEK